MSGSITINGNVYEGNDIVVKNNNVYINGKKQISNVKKELKIIVTGNLASLDCGGSATINGDVIGDVDCGSSCRCDNVGGNVDAGSSVVCGTVGGSVDAGSSIRMERG